MKKLGITAHCLVRNEENWVWYAINSVLDYVDQILVFDTGSTDNTVKIIQSIKSPKIIFEQKGVVDKKQYAQLRQEMLERNKTPWFMILDGDEIWFDTTMKEVLSCIRRVPQAKHAIVVGEWMCQGDVFHYSRHVEQLQDPNVPQLSGYRLVRIVRNLPGLQVVGSYGFESYADKNDLNISYWPKERLVYIKNRFFHTSFLRRSSSIANDRQVMMRGPKTRFTSGIPFPQNFHYPEVLYKPHPEIVPAPWRKITLLDQLTGLYYRSQNYLQRYFNE